MRIFKIVLFVCFFILISSSSTPKLFRTCDDRLHCFVAMSSCVKTILGLPIIYTTYGPFSRVVYRVFFYPCNTCWYNIIKRNVSCEIQDFIETHRYCSIIPVPLFAPRVFIFMLARGSVFPHPLVSYSRKMLVH